MLRTSNPALRADTFGTRALPGTDVMTVQGTVNKTGLSLLILIAAAAFSWNAGPLAPLLALVGMIGGLVFALCTIFKNTWAPVTTPLYAAFEGLLLGAISNMFQQRYPGIAFNAVALTFGTLAALLVAYSSGLVRATENFKLGVVAATGAIALLYMVSMVMGFFGHRIPGIFDSGAVGVAFSLFVVLIAALNLVLDFDFIERGAAHGAPRYMEWVGAFGLLVTLVWLYLEILRLLAKLQGRDRR
jgi:uncharacterized YccA/Bax inhibitor family protein